MDLGPAVGTQLGQPDQNRARPAAAEIERRVAADRRALGNRLAPLAQCAPCRVREVDLGGPAARRGGDLELVERRGAAQADDEPDALLQPAEPVARVVLGLPKGALVAV